MSKCEAIQCHDLTGQGCVYIYIYINTSSTASTRVISALLKAMQAYLRLCGYGKIYLTLYAPV